MFSLKKQSGMTAIGWVLVLLLVVVFALLFITVLPMYLNGFKIQSALNAVKTGAEYRSASPEKIKSGIIKVIGKNGIDPLSLEDDNDPGLTLSDILVTRTGNTYSVTIDFQSKKRLFGDTYILIFFKESTELPVQ